MLDSSFWGGSDGLTTIGKLRRTESVAACRWCATGYFGIAASAVALPLGCKALRACSRDLNPGGNITGTTSVSPELWGKTFQILRELIPQTSHVAYFFDPDFPGITFYLRQVEQTAKSLGIRISAFPVRTVTDIDSALASLLRDRPNAVNVGMTGVLIEHVGRIIEFAARHKLPVLYSIRDLVEKGGLISYAPDFGAMGVRNSWMIDKIFKGEKPSDIPVEEPARFHLTINMKTAKAMGLVIPPIVLLQATELIE